MHENPSRPIYPDETVPIIVDREYTANEYIEIIKMATDAHVDPLPYLCREVWPIRHSILRSIHIAARYKITPELYWSGEVDDYTMLLCLLEDGYPNIPELLRVAALRIEGSVRSLSQYFYHSTCIMFDYHSSYKGYVILKPSKFMEMLYPNTNGLLYVYTTDVWEHKDGSDHTRPLLILKEEDSQSIGEWIRKLILKLPG